MGFRIAWLSTSVYRTVNSVRVSRLSFYFLWLSLRNSGTKMPRQFYNFSVCVSNTSQKNCRRLSRNLRMLRRQWLRHTSAFCQGLWFVFLTVQTSCSTYVFMTHVNVWNRRQYFFRWSPCFGFFMCPWYSKRTQYLKLEKSGAQIYSSVWDKVSNVNWAITENWDDKKNPKRLPEIKV